MTDESDDEVYVTLKYNGIQNKIQFDYDYDDLFRGAIKKYNLDKDKFDLLFYYFDNENEKVLIEKEATETFLQQIYKENNGNLMINVEAKPKDGIIGIKKQKSKEDSQKSNISFEDSDNSSKNSEDNPFYQDVNEMANQIKIESKTEENKEIPVEIKAKNNFDINSDNEIFQSFIFTNKKNSKIIEEKKRKLEETKTRKISILEKQKSLVSKNETLKNKIAEKKALIEEKKKKKYDEDDVENKKILIKLQKEEKKLQNLENQKLKEIESLKEKNLKLEKLISELSLQLSKQKEKMVLEEENSINFHEPLNNTININLSLSEISKNSSIFFSRYEDANDYFGINEKIKKKKEKKMKRIQRLNELYRKNKEPYPHGLAD